MFRIENIEINGNAVMAPVAGFTDSPYRRIARTHGSAMVVTELISTEGIIRNAKKTMDLLRFDESERPIAVQLFGKSGDALAEAAVIAESLGYDMVDINLGCPAPRVVKAGTGAGSALLRDPSKIRRITEKVKCGISIPLTAKIRLGWNNREKNYRDVVRALEDGGVSAIFVHGRTAAQKYTGTADWNSIRDIREIALVPIVGNGDISSLMEAKSRMDESGCPAVMIGRAALGNPWIFSEKSPSMVDIVNQIKEHMDMMLDHYGERGIILMRKHFVKYIHNFPGASAYRAKLVKAERRGVVIEILDAILDASCGEAG